MVLLAAGGRQGLYCDGGDIVPLAGSEILRSCELDCGGGEVDRTSSVCSNWSKKLSCLFTEESEVSVVDTV